VLQLGRRKETIMTKVWTAAFTATVLLAPTLVHAQFLKPPTPVPVPEFNGDAVVAKPVLDAVTAVLVAQSEETSTAYEIPSLECTLLTVPNVPQVMKCQFTYLVEGDEAFPVNVSDGAGTMLATNLYSALQEAGAKPVDDPHFFRMTLEDLNVSADHIKAKDKSNWTPPSKPNVQVTGALAQGIIQVVKRAGIVDTDRSLKFVCGSTNEPLSCTAFSSKSVNNGQPQPSLDATTTKALWKALKAALADAVRQGTFKPISGTIDQINLINAWNFQYDGTTLGFAALADHATPPPPPAGL
jgi:hypothetical protein